MAVVKEGFIWINSVTGLRMDLPWLFARVRARCSGCSNSLVLLLFSLEEVIFVILTGKTINRHR